MKVTDGERGIPLYVHDAGYDEAPLTWDLRGPLHAVDPVCPGAPDPPRQVLVAGVVRDTGKKVKGSAVPAMKVTVSAAMRARDVSRPRPEHLAEAEAAEASAPKGAWGNGPGEPSGKGPGEPSGKGPGEPSGKGPEIGRAH